MPRLHRVRYLTCFYCGRKTSTAYDGRTRRFECPSCDATNYLDEHGDITDPPVATDKEATPRQFAVPRTTTTTALSPPSSPTGYGNDDNDSNNGSATIFCATCLKNQHLLSASLAQYLPDPDDPDYAERERGLYRFRRNQERLYPQICAACEPRVRRRLEQAAYTAKTDLLRRMLDRSAGARGKGVVKAGGWLERCDRAGRWLWIGAFVLQLAWHAVVVHALVLRYFVWAGVMDDESLLTVRLLRRCAPLVGSLPPAERLLGWSVLASVLGVWWNPRFAQICRGFTRHISGVPKWYFFQVLAVLLRICLQRVDLTTPDPMQLQKQAAGHAFAAGLAVLISLLAPRSIKINMAPLFGATSPTQPLQLHDPPEPASSASRPDETKSIADLLDEISRSPASPTPPSPVDVSPSILRRTNALPMGHAHTQAAQTLSASLQQINALNLRQPFPSSVNSHSPQPRPFPTNRQPFGLEEMDWSPTPFSSQTNTHNTTTGPLSLSQQQNQDLSTKSTHRAFATQGQRPAQPFGAAPTEPRASPFWYRVPPAPTTPAQRVFNPPNQPRLRPSPSSGGGVGPSSLSPGGGGAGGVGGGQGGGLYFGRGGEGGVGGRTSPLTTGVSGRGGDGVGGERKQTTVAFAEPSFFAENVLSRSQGGDRGGGDPRNELSGMFGRGFSLDGEEGGRAREGGGGSGGWFSRLVGGGQKEDGRGKKNA